MTSKKKGASDTEAPAKHRWVFNARFRRHAFGWRSQAAVTRVKEAVAEIKAVSFVRREMSHPAGLIGCCRRRGWASDAAIDSLCEEILLSSGKADDAYDCYALRANQRGTFLATFRAVTNRYPHKSAREILADLARTTPGDEGKWFATAKDAGLLDEAIALARRSPSDPKTLARAARDFAEDEPGFALQSGLLSLHWLVQGYGYELTSADVWMA